MSDLDSNTPSEPESQSEETKRKFREALERKNHQNAKSTDHRDGQSKVHNTHGPADHKREFRRKIG
jgi:hypothetical protein